MLLVGTDLPAADVAFSAGFSSVRQFNETVREVFGMPPLELRARRRRALGGPLDGTDAPGAIDLVLPHRGPLDADGLFAWMGARAISGVESATATSFARTLRLAGGPAWFELRLDEVGRVRLRARLTHLGDLSTLVTRARRLFDLDADPIAVDEALARHPELAPLVARGPGHPRARRRRPARDAHPGDGRPADHGHRGPHRADGAGRRAGGAGRDGSEPASRARLFPTMAAIAERGHEVLRGPAARTRAIVGAAAALADGTLTLGPGDDGADQRAALLAMPGIGPVDGRLRAHARDRRPRRLPARRRRRPRRRRRGRASRPRRAPSTQWAARTAPWRSYLTAHLWRAVPPRPRRVGADRAPPRHTVTRHAAPPVRRPSTEETPK